MNDDYLSAVDEVLAAGGNPGGAEDTTAPEPVNDLDTLRPIDDPYDRAVGEIVTENETRLRASVLAAQEQNPDIAAQVQQVAREVGWPVGAAMRQPEAYLRDYKVQDTLTRIMNAPVTKNWLTDPASSAIAHDDVAPLVDIEKRMFEYGTLSAAEPPEGTLLNALNAGLTATRQSIDRLAAQAGVLRGTFRGMLRDTFGLPGDDFDIYGNPVAPDTNLNAERDRLRRLDFAAEMVLPRFDETTLEGRAKAAATSGFVSAGQQAPTLAAGAALRGVLGLVTGLGAAAVGSGGDQAARVLDRGGSNAEAFLAGSGSGTVEALTELIPMGKLLDAFGSKGAREFMESAIASVMADVPGEQIATLAQDAIDTATANPDMTWGEYWKDRPGAAFDTLIATLTQGAVTVGAGAAGKATINALGGADKAAQTAESLKTVLDTASQSKVRERDPSGFAGLVQQSADKAGAPDVYIEAEAFAQAIEAAGDEGRAVLDRMPSAAAQLLDAAMTGADVRLPLGEFVAAVSGTPMADSLLQHVRSTPEAMSAAQAQQMADTNFEGLRSEAAEIIDSATVQSERQASADAVYQRVLGDLSAANRFTPDVNAAYATLTRDFFTVLADRLGIDPQEAFNRYPLRVTGAPVVGPGLDQSKIETLEFKAWFGDSKVVDDSGEPLVVYHGTDRKFTKFSPSKSIGGMFWFTSNKTAIDAGEIGAAGKGVVVDAYLSIKNPAGWAEYEKFGIEELKAQGYDGLALPESDGTLYVAFDPRQIKSASRNRGTFDPNDANILHQDAVAAVTLAGDELAPKGAPIEDLRKAARAFWKANLAKTKVAHPTLGEIAFTGKGEGKLFSSSANADKLRLVAALADIVKNATVSGEPREVTGKDGHRQDITRFYYLTAPVRLDGRDLTVGVTVFEDRHGNKFYNINDTAESQKARRFARQETGSSEPSQDAQDATTDTASTEAGDGTTRPDDALEQNVGATADGVNLTILEQSARGTFTPSTNTIALLKDADLSTYLHELGHFFLETYTHLAAQPNAPAQIADDMQVLLKWFKVKDIETWRGMTLDQQREHHEKFARGFETYLFSGEAPNAEIQSLFQRFRAWLVAVYKSVSRLNVDLTAEVRGVMDRMIATDAQIAQAEALRRYRPLFESAEAMGVSPEEFAVYQSLGAEATVKATEQLDKRSLKDMKWMADAKAKALRALQKETRAKRAEVMAEVRAEVLRMPVYAAQRFLSHGELPDAERNKDQRRIAQQAGQEGNKLDLAVLKEMYGEEANALWRYLPVGRYGYATQQGTHPDAVAELFGFTSGDELVRKILAAEPMTSVIEGMTDQRMLERYGDISSPEALERAAEAAIHNEARGRFVAAELKALNAANNAKSRDGIDRNGRPVSVNLIAKAARQFAAQLIAAKKVRDLRPALFAQAEGKNARLAEQMLRKNDLPGAAAAKRQQMLAYYSAREATTAQTEVQKGLDYLRKFAKDGVRKAIDPDYVAQIDAILERYDLRRSTTARQVARRQSLAEWVKAQEDMGFSPPIDPALLADSKLVSYKDLTVEQFRGLVESVKVIDHLGRLKNKLLTAKDQRDWEAIQTELVNSIIDNAGEREVSPASVNTWQADIARGAKNYFYEHLKMATIARVLDGGKDGGPFWEYFVRGMNEAGNKETTWRAQAAKAVSDILAPVMRKGGLRNGEQYFPSIGQSLNREAVMTIALNVGNESNLQRLLDGGIRESGPIQVEQLQPVLDTLTEQEWQAVQAVWDYFESFKPEIGAKERRVNGVEPEWIEATPVVTSFGTLRGGYYPVKYDPAASIRAEEHADAEAARQAMGAAYTSATTRRSFTKARVAEVKGRPLLLDFSGIYSGLNEVIHDLAWHEWLIDANRIAKSDGIDKAIRRTYGPEFKAQFKTLLEDVARGDGGTSTAADRVAGFFRRNATRAGLALNVMNALQQVTGLAPAAVRVGGSHMLRGLGRFMTNPAALYRETSQRSDFMRDRARTRMRELNEVRNQVRGQGAVVKAYDQVAYILMLKMQQVVDNITWWGSFEKALADGNDDARASALADQTVIDTQGSGMWKDLSAVERRSIIAKLSSFYSYFNAMLNLTVAEQMTSDSRARLAGSYLMIYAVPAAIMAAMTTTLVAGGDDDEPWPVAFGKAFGEQIIGMPLSLFAWVREASSVPRALIGEAPGYTGPTALRWVADLQKFIGQAKQLELDMALARATVRLAGDLTGAPAGQINRTMGGVEAIAKGDSQNPLAVLFGYRD
jgi:hypothetical protein